MLVFGVGRNSSRRDSSLHIAPYMLKPPPKTSYLIGIDISPPVEALRHRRSEFNEAPSSARLVSENNISRRTIIIAIGGQQTLTIATSTASRDPSIDKAGKRRWHSCAQEVATVASENA